MNSDIIIDVQKNEVSIAVIENDRLVELQREKQNVAYSVGDIYLGKVKKVMPGLNAAFIDIGHPKEAFLHYRDLGASFSSAQKFLSLASDKKAKDQFWSEQKLDKDIPKDGQIADILKSGNHVLVQITKEAISTKGPRLTGEVSFAGRYLVVIPFSDKVSVSQKIRSNEEKTRLKQLILSIKPKNVSVIVRTSAEGVRVAELDYELRTLLKKWEKMCQTLRKADDKKKSVLLHEESNRLLSLLRDTYSSDYKHIYINDKSVLDETKEYIELIDPGKGKIVEFYDDKKPIFDHFNITRQIKSLFGRTVTYKSGAYLIIEQTEAMHVIDVNSGNRAKSSNAQEDTAIDVNLSAAEEIARQLRLRDLGGIIVVDFIDMNVASNRQKLFEYMNEVMKPDRAKHSILPLSKFGVMQITRERVRPSTKVETMEICPTCQGKGKITSTLFFVDEIEGKIEKLMKEENVKKLYVHVHPFVSAYLTKGFLSLGSVQSKWRKNYGKGLNIVPNESLGMLDVEFFDNEKNDLSHFLEDHDKNEIPD